MYYFSRISTEYPFVWFIEEDVFIPSVQAFVALHALYSLAHDLVAAEPHYNTNGNIHSWFHWSLAPGTFVLPWGHGMVCAVGCSRRLLSAVNDYARWRGELTFIEFMLHTIVIHDSQMQMVTPYELSTIVFRKEHTLKQIKERPNNWWHPVKDLSLHDEWRKRLAQNSSTSKKQTFVEFDALNQRMKSTTRTNATVNLQNQLKDLLAELEIVKGYLNPAERRQLRDDFLRLAENRSASLEADIRRLADHTFMLPKPYFDPYHKQEKTMTHVKLQETIASKKETIYRLTEAGVPSSDAMTRIDQLRNETRHLILALTHEIKCEQEFEQCNRTEQRIKYHYRKNWSFRRDSVQQLGVLVPFILCLLMILHRVKRTKYCSRRNALVVAHDDSVS